jgi:hypothetical protein
MKQKLNNIWIKILCVAEEIGRVRAATSLARHGHYKLARDIMLQPSEWR